VLVRCLSQRGVTDAATARALIDAETPNDDPFDLFGMNEAVDRILSAVAAGEQIVVFGDFDADGVTATAALVETLSALGGRVLPFIPHRERDGYGLREAAIEHVAGGGADLLITVDCGIRAADEVALARTAGIDVIITDHHEPPDRLPDAVAIINPRAPGCEYQHKDLAGVGLAYKLSQGLLRSAPVGDPEAMEESLLDLVAIGTVADVVPLVGENRSLVMRGLRVLRRAERPGIRALLASSKRQAESITARDIAFVLAPRVNAAGRMASAELALELMLSNDPAEARRLAEILESYNNARRDATTSALAAAEADLAGRTDLPLLMHASGDVGLGITGLVAGRLSSRYHRPAAVLKVRGDTARGSARSIAEFNIIEALEQISELLVRFGGHARAAGFTVRKDDLAEVEDRLVGIAEDALRGMDLRRRLDIDAEVEPHQLTWALDDVLSVLEPCGEGNRQPLLLVRDAAIASVRRVGTDHLRFVLDCGPAAGSIDAIAFGQADCLPKLGRRAAVVFSLEKNTWRGRRRLELHVEDLADPGEVCVERNGAAMEA
jgi:single-stranded-DNA-specific exonuclease